MAGWKMPRIGNRWSGRWDAVAPTDPLPETQETEPIIGYRRWKIADSPEGIPILYSITQDHCWLPYEPCVGKPELDNWEGIYALNSLDELKTNSLHFISGTVSLWGKVIDCESGYRAEFAYPKELLCAKEFPADMRTRLQETYGVTVIERADFVLEKEYPISPPSRGIVAGVLEIVREAIYDREPIKGPRTRLFVIPIGAQCYSVDPETDEGTAHIKDYTDTNMLMAGMLPLPHRFMAKSIRVVILENGRPVPLSDPLWWKSNVRFEVLGKIYWQGVTAHVADPKIALAATDWSAIPAAERANLIHSMTHSLAGDGGFSFPGLSPAPTPPLEGVLIDQAMNFGIAFELGHDVDWRQHARREVFCAIEGILGRAVF